VGRGEELGVGIRNQKKTLLRVGVWVKGKGGGGAVGWGGRKEKGERKGGGGGV